MNMNTAEKIETIVDCFLRSGATEGVLGTLHVIEPGWFRVVADGLTTIVRTPFRRSWPSKASPASTPSFTWQRITPLRLALSATCRPWRSRWHERSRPAAQPFRCGRRV